MKNSEMVPFSRNEIGTRVTAVVAKAGGINEVVKKTGWAVSSLRRWMNGDTPIKLEDAQQLCEMTETSLGWLATGVGATEYEGSTVDGLAVIQDAEARAVIAVNSALLGAERLNHQAYKVHGDAMLPALPPGATAIVDGSQVELLDGQIYMLSLGGAVTFRRAQAAVGGFRLVADNSKYESYTLDAIGSDSIAGRVVLALASV